MMQATEDRLLRALDRNAQLEAHVQCQAAPTCNLGDVLLSQGPSGASAEPATSIRVDSGTWDAAAIALGREPAPQRLSGTSPPPGERLRPPSLLRPWAMSGAKAAQCSIAPSGETADVTAPAPKDHACHWHTDAAAKPRRRTDVRQSHRKREGSEEELGRRTFCRSKKLARRAAGEAVHDEDAAWSSAEEEQPNVASEASSGVPRPEPRLAFEESIEPLQRTSRKRATAPAMSFGMDRLARSEKAPEARSRGRKTCVHV